MQVEEVLREALNLDVRDRASLAEQLLASLDYLSEDEAERVWTAEAQGRLHEARSDRSKLIASDAVHRRLESP